MDQAVEPGGFLRVFLSSALALVSLIIVNWAFGLRQRPPPGERWGLKHSNLADEFSHSELHAKAEDGWKVKSIWIYPVKSCRGIELAEANVVATGLQYDRQFVLAEWIVNEKTGAGWKFITQRKYPKMARITTELYVDPMSETGGSLSMTFPVRRPFFIKGSRSFRVPLDANEKIMSKFPLKPVNVWKDTPYGHDMSAPVASELSALSQFLGTKSQLALFRTSITGMREIYRCAPRKKELGRQPITGFADAYPLHMLNLSSVRDVNSRICDKIENLSVQRFRANIIVTGPKAFDEDDWKRISFNGNQYYVACRTVRCKLPNVHQETGEKHPQEPDQTLRRYRSIDEGAKGMACLGMQLVPADESSTLRVGDRLVVHERGSHLYIRQ